MPLDYGAIARRRRVSGMWFGAALALAVIAAILVRNWGYHRSVEQAQGWVGAGAPCPTISAAVYDARGYRAHERIMDYDGAAVARQFGHVMCKDVDTPGRLGFVTHPVCQFTSPTAIRVRTGWVETFFEPGPGAVATVSLASGGAACVLTGRFTLFADPTS